MFRSDWFKYCSLWGFVVEPLNRFHTGLPTSFCEVLLHAYYVKNELRRFSSIKEANERYTVRPASRVWRPGDRRYEDNRKAHRMPKLWRLPNECRAGERRRQSW